MIEYIKKIISYLHSTKNKQPSRQPGKFTLENKSITRKI